MMMLIKVREENIERGICFRLSLELLDQCSELIEEFRKYRVFFSSMFFFLCQLKERN